MYDRLLHGNYRIRGPGGPTHREDLHRFEQQISSARIRHVWRCSPHGPRCDFQGCQLERSTCRCDMCGDRWPHVHHGVDQAEEVHLVMAFGTEVCPSLLLIDIIFCY